MRLSKFDRQILSSLGTMGTRLMEAKDIAERLRFFGFWAPSGRVYVSLFYLEQRKLVRGIWGLPTILRGNARIRYYYATALGKTLANPS